MLTNSPTVYESWDLMPLDRPPQSRLYHLEPIGLGTPYVESLTSYVARLAEAHSVSAQFLIAQEIGLALGKGTIIRRHPQTKQMLTYSNVQTILPELNGKGITAADWIRTLETLTLRKDLRFLTLSPWAEVLSDRHLLRAYRAWCSQCYAQWRRQEEPVYEPLLWVLDVVRVCPYHQQPLRWGCPHCHQKSPWLGSYAPPGHCLKCGQWLGEPEPVPHAGREERASDDLNWSLWVADTVGELLAVAPAQRAFPARERMAGAIAWCIDQVTRGNASAFARLMGLNANEVGLWSRGTCRPRLSRLLQVCQRVGTSLRNLLVDDTIRIQMPPVTPAVHPKKPCDRNLVLHALQAALVADSPPSVKEVAHRLGYGASTPNYHYPELCQALSARHNEYRKACKKAAWEKVRASLERALYEEYPPVSIGQLAKRLGRNPSNLCRRFPDLCKALSARRVEYRKACAEERRVRLIQEVREVVFQLYSEGIYPSQLRVRQCLSTKGANPTFDAARYEMLRELGIERKEFGR